MPNANSEIPATIPIVNLTGKQTRRFWQRVAIGKPNECWPWTGYRDKDGYGGYAVFKERRISFRAHRIAYAIAKGEIPSGMLVLHDCDNPPCCNPAHLKLGTCQDNNRERNKKGRQAKGDNTVYRLYPELKMCCEKNPRARLTREQVSQIRALHVPRLRGPAALAKMFGVGSTTVQHILKRDTWKDVE